jgi:hypothetical protein
MEKPTVVIYNRAGQSADNSDCDFQSSMDVNDDDVALPRAAPYGMDRPRAFVIDDAPDQPPSVFYAKRQVKGRSNSGRQSSGQIAVAVAVRERGTEKFSNILRFVHSLPEPINLLTNTWIASPRKEIYANFMFGSWVKRIFPPQ